MFDFMCLKIVKYIVHKMLYLDELEEVMAERKLSKEVSKTSEFVTGVAPRLPKPPGMYTSGT